jgi:hypothetical protein
VVPGVDGVRRQNRAGIEGLERLYRDRTFRVSDVEVFFPLRSIAF